MYLQVNQPIQHSSQTRFWAVVSTLLLVTFTVVKSLISEGSTAFAGGDNRFGRDDGFFQSKMVF
jgi:hypothetical protein